ncbi:MAG: PBP1A family penicillin-binding protein [Pseudomonadota bacterium]
MARRSSKSSTARKSKGRRGGPSRRSVRAPRRTPPRISGYLMALRHVAAAFSFLCLIGAAFIFYYAADLPSTSGLWSVDRRPAVTVLDRRGEKISVYGLTYGAPVRLADLPPHVGQAVIALEDRNFHHHVGVNPLSVLRALLVNAKEGEIRQGASTITQQLAKNLFLSPEKTLKRKVQEAILALWLEARFSKDEILTLYLNRVYFGAGAYGIEAAAQRYFGVAAEDLSIGQSAVLAGLLKAPSRYAPTHSPEGAAGRGTMALDAMVEAGFLTPRERVLAAEAPVVLAAQGASAGSAHFVDYVVAVLPDLIGAYDADIIARTSLDLSVQRAAEAAVLSAAADGAFPAEAEAAFVALDLQGGVTAMVGGRDYAASQFNRAVNARRQPGSAFKPFVYLAALEAGFSPRSRVIDAPLTLGNWSPANYRDKYYGKVTLTDALAKSLNTAAVRVSERVGPGRAAGAARRLGVKSDVRVHRSLALGVSEVTLLELTNAYAPFANGGYAAPVHAVLEVETAEGRLLYERAPQGAKRVIAEKNWRDIAKMLEVVVAEGTGRRAQLPGRTVAGKTGTTQGYRDAWFIGYAEDYIAGVWVGRDDNAPLGDVTGGRAPAEIWRRAAGASLPGAPARALKPFVAYKEPSPALQTMTAPTPAASEGKTMEDLLAEIAGGEGF